jgi:hypothetical protein
MEMDKSVLKNFTMVSGGKEITHAGLMAAPRDSEQHGRVEVPPGASAIQPARSQDSLGRICHP